MMGNHYLVTVALFFLRGGGVFCLFPIARASQSAILKDKRTLDE